jgi:hypothetical protein
VETLALEALLISSQFLKRLVLNMDLKSLFTVLNLRSSQELRLKI